MRWKKEEGLLFSLMNVDGLSEEDQGAGHSTMVSLKITQKITYLQDSLVKKGVETTVFGPLFGNFCVLPPPSNRLSRSATQLSKKKVCRYAV